MLAGLSAGLVLLIDDEQAILSESLGPVGIVRTQNRIRQPAGNARMIQIDQFSLNLLETEQSSLGRFDVLQSLVHFLDGHVPFKANPSFLSVLGIAAQVQLIQGQID